jgi:hypothetical protein
MALCRLGNVNVVVAVDVALRTMVRVEKKVVDAVVVAVAVARRRLVVASPNFPET